MKGENILENAIAEAKTLRKLAMENGKYSLKKFLIEEKLPLYVYADEEIDLDAFVSMICRKGKAKEKDEQELNAKGLPYLNNAHKNRRKKIAIDKDIDERARNGMRRDLTDEDELTIDYGDSEEEPEEEKLGNELQQENIRRWNLKTNTRTSPVSVSLPKISEAERNLLLKHAGLLNKNKYIHHINENKESKDFLKKRAGIKETGKAKQLIADLNTKMQIIRG